MSEGRYDSEGSRVVKRQKTENMDSSKMYLQGMDEADGGVPLYPHSRTDKPAKPKKEATSEGQLYVNTSLLNLRC